MLTRIPHIVNSASEYVAQLTKGFTGTRFGQIFLLAVLLGPLTFIPTVYEAWTSPNIDALRTWTWPLMTVVVTAEFISVVHEGDWRMRLSLFFWIVMMVSVWVATLVR
jgi:hypothetical protein